MIPAICHSRIFYERVAVNQCTSIAPFHLRLEGKRTACRLRDIHPARNIILRASRQVVERLADIRTGATGREIFPGVVVIKNQLAAAGEVRVCCPGVRPAIVVHVQFKAGVFKKVVHG